MSRDPSRSSPRHAPVNQPGNTVQPPSSAVGMSSYVNPQAVWQASALERTLYAVSSSTAETVVNRYSTTATSLGPGPSYSPAPGAPGTDPPRVTTSVRPSSPSLAAVKRGPPPDKEVRKLFIWPKNPTLLDGLPVPYTSNMKRNVTGILYFDDEPTAGSRSSVAYEIGRTGTFSNSRQQTQYALSMTGEVIHWEVKRVLDFSALPLSSLGRYCREVRFCLGSQYNSNLQVYAGFFRVYKDNAETSSSIRGIAAQPTRPLSSPESSRTPRPGGHKKNPSQATVSRSSAVAPGSFAAGPAYSSSPGPSYSSAREVPGPGPIRVSGPVGPRRPSVDAVRWGPLPDKDVRELFIWPKNPTLLNGKPIPFAYTVKKNQSAILYFEENRSNVAYEICRTGSFSDKRQRKQYSHPKTGEIIHWVVKGVVDYAKIPRSYLSAHCKAVNFCLGSQYDGKQQVFVGLMRKYEGDAETLIALREGAAQSRASSSALTPNATPRPGRHEKSPVRAPRPDERPYQGRSQSQASRNV